MKPKQSETGEPTAISWNLVTNGGCDPDAAVHTELRARIERLSLLASGFPAEQVHLLISLSGIEGTAPKRVEVRLDLKLPTTVLHVQDKGEDLPEALRHSFFVLEQQTEAVRAGRRGERRWNARRKSLPNTGAPTSSSPVKEEPKTQRDQVRNFIFLHYNRLLLHANRRVSGLEAAGEIPPGCIDAQEVLDEVTRICLESPGRKPAELTYELWLYRLISEELEREYQEWARSYREPEEFPEAGLDIDDGQSRQSAITLGLDPDEMPDEDLLLDSGSPPPDLVLEESDLVAEILSQVRHWKKRDREIFNLHFLDGFDAVETALVEKMEVSEVEKTIKRLRRRLQGILRDAAR